MDLLFDLHGGGVTSTAAWIWAGSSGGGSGPRDGLGGPDQGLPIFFVFYFINLGGQSNRLG